VNLADTQRGFDSHVEASLGYRDHDRRIFWHQKRARHTAHSIDVDLHLFERTDAARRATCSRILLSVGRVNGDGHAECNESDGLLPATRYTHGPLLISLTLDLGR